VTKRRHLIGQRQTKGARARNTFALQHWLCKVFTLQSQCWSDVGIGVEKVDELRAEGSHCFLSRSSLKLSRAKYHASTDEGARVFLSMETIWRRFLGELELPTRSGTNLESKPWRLVAMRRDHNMILNAEEVRGVSNYTTGTQESRRRTNLAICSQAQVRNHCRAHRSARGPRGLPSEGVIGAGTRSKESRKVQGSRHRRVTTTFGSSGDPSSPIAPIYTKLCEMLDYGSSYVCSKFQAKRSM
jgi:hypothetical protein